MPVPKQSAKVTKSNILFLNEHFYQEINILDLISILLRKIKENIFFENSKFKKMPLSSKVVEKFTICTLYEIKCLSEEEFNAVKPVEKQI